MGGACAGDGWRCVFLINVPVAVAVVTLAHRFVPESRDPNPPQHLDLVGAELGALGLGGMTYALIAAGSGWSAGLMVILALGLLALGAFVVNERRSPNPMVPPAMFENRQFSAANLQTLLVYAALGGVFFFLVIDLQVVAGFSPILAGSAFCQGHS